MENNESIIEARARVIQSLTERFAQEPEFLTVERAAELLSISPRTMYRLKNTGQIPSVRLSVNCVRICKFELINYAAQRMSDV